MAWTDDRLDDLANRMDAGFAHADRALHALRLEVKADMVALRTELKGDIAASRTELKGGIDTSRTELKGEIDTSRTELKGEIDRLHALIVRFGVAILICLVTVIGALIGVIPGGSASG
jgi:hypothetical protein